MFGRRGTPQGASTKARDQAAPYLKTFQEQTDRFLSKARECHSRGEYALASSWAAQARRCVDNAQRIEAALS